MTENVSLFFERCEAEPALKARISEARKREIQKIAARMGYCPSAAGRILKSKNIHTWVDYWGFDVHHDWDWWYKEVVYFLPYLLGEDV